MAPIDSNDGDAILLHIKRLAGSGRLKVTQHAQQEMANDDASVDEVLAVIATSRILENYPTHQRGACCLLCGYTGTGRALHVVCTTVQPVLILITVYEPKLPKWITPNRRGPRS